MLRSDLCDYSDAYIVVTGIIIANGTVEANKINKKLTFKTMFHLCHIYQKPLTHL